jgi:hypothetical protein
MLFVKQPTVGFRETSTPMTSALFEEGNGSGQTPRFRIVGRSSSSDFEKSEKVFQKSLETNSSSLPGSSGGKI